MRSALVLLFALLVSVPRPSQVIAGPRVGDAPYHIVLPRHALRAGEQVEMKLLPPVSPDARVHWPEATGRTNLIYSAIYRAPYVIPPGTPPVTITVGISEMGVRSGASTDITLLPGSVPGSEDCLGPGQTFSPTAGTIIPEYTYAEELPELIHRIDPVYPRSAQARGIEDTMLVLALVCRTGRVLDAYLPYSYVDTRDPRPIERDPKLVEAAIAAVRQYVFKPALTSGQPIAVWVATTVAFRLE